MNRILNDDGSFTKVAPAKLAKVVLAPSQAAPIVAVVKTVDEMSVPEMRVYAKENEISLEGLKKKDDIYDAIMAVVEVDAEL